MSARASGQPAISRDALMDIARQFVTRVGGKLSAIKAAEQKGAPSLPDSDEILTMIPDGGTLLFVPKVGDLVYERDIAAIKERGAIYLSLEDMIDVLELAVDYDPQKERARGWYLREDWPLAIDAKQKTVFYRDKQFDIKDGDVFIQDGEVYVSTAAWTTWVDMDMKLSLAEQYVEIKTPYPLPAVARHLRSQRDIAGGDNNMTQLPRKSPVYNWMDMHSASVDLNSRVRHDPGKTELTSGGSVAVEGQMLKHDAYGLTTFDRDRGVTSFTGRLSKNSENPDLLGALKARSYTIGDTNTTDIPLTGSSPQEIGFRINNNPLATSSFERTDINGDALPGWDVELYRSGTLVDKMTVSNDGRYDFPEVQLFAGDNHFEVLFYGPQGEIRSEKFEVPVTAALLATQKNTYDVSLTFEDSHIYRDGESETNDPDKNKPHIAARYNTFIGDTLVYAGIRNRDIDGINKTFLGTGFTKLLDETIFDGNFAVDEKGAAAGELSARRTINDWQLGLSGLAQTEDFSASNASPSAGSTLSVTADVNHSFTPPIGTAANLNATATYGEGPDTTSKLLNIGLSDQIGRLSLNDAFGYNADTSGGVTETTVSNTMSTRTNFGKASLRGGVTYAIRPVSEISEYFGELDYRHSDKMTSDVSVTHNPGTKFTEGHAGITYINDKFRLSPFVEYNSDRETYAGVNLNFNMIKPPSQLTPIMTSQPVIGRGMVSSFVYFDKNGNETFDPGDEPLPDVVVESVNIHRRETTNKDGYSLIADLPNTRATDIHVDTSSLPDPFMISSYDGASIFPTAGEIVQLQFPIHLSGEIDGTVGLSKGPGLPLLGARAQVQLLPIDGKNKTPVTADAASDGYYSISQVPPGTYLLSVLDRSAQKLNAGAPTPSIIHVGYDGPVIAGQDITLVEGRAHVPVSVQNVVAGVPEGAPVYALKIRQGGKSELLGLLRKFALERSSRGLFDDLQKTDAIGEKEPQVTYYRVPGNDLRHTYERCATMASQGISCEVVAFVRLINSKPIKTAMAN